MIGLVALAVMAVIVLTAGIAVLKLVVWTLLLPIRILLGLVFVPLLLLKAVAGGLLLLVIGPVVLIATIAVLVAMVAAIAVPLLPLLILAFIVWLVAGAGRRSPGIVRS
jgi:hypothetical protein